MKVKVCEGLCVSVGGIVQVWTKTDCSWDDSQSLSDGYTVSP